MEAQANTQRETNSGKDIALRGMWEEIRNNWNIKRAHNDGAQRQETLLVSYLWYWV